MGRQRAQTTPGQGLNNERGLGRPGTRRKMGGFMRQVKIATSTERGADNLTDGNDAERGERSIAQSRDVCRAC